MRVARAPSFDQEGERLLSDGIPRGHPKRELPFNRAARSEQLRLAQSGGENLSGSLDLVGGASELCPRGHTSGDGLMRYESLLVLLLLLYPSQIDIWSHSDGCSIFRGLRMQSGNS